MTAVDVRPLDDKDLPDVAEIHARAFPESTVTLLGTDAICRYYEAHLASTDDAIALGAFIDGGLQGFLVAGSFSRGTRRSVLRNSRLAIGRTLSRPATALDRRLWAALFSRARDLGRRLTLRLRAESASSMQVPDFQLLNIAVNPDAQHAGLGRTLLTELERHATTHGISRMALVVRPANAAAIHLYETTGWTRVSVGDRWTGDMVKELASTAGPVDQL